MNQDKVKRLLLDTAEAQTEFTVIFSGRESPLVNGLYKPATREIIIHNRNFASDDQLIYTALHEYAHHLHCERKGGLASGRAHTNEFWGIFHELLVEAEAKGHYRNLFDVEPEFIDLTRRIKASCLAENGRLMLEFGRLMIEAQGLCRRFKARFEDYVDRALGVPRATASSAARAATYDIDPDVGWDGMKMRRASVIPACEPKRSRPCAAARAPLRSRRVFWHLPGPKTPPSASNAKKSDSSARSSDSASGLPKWSSVWPRCRPLRETR